MLIYAEVVMKFEEPFTDAIASKKRDSLVTSWFEPLKQTGETLQDYTLDVSFSNESQKLTFAYSITDPTTHTAFSHETSYTVDEMILAAAAKPKRLKFDISTPDMAQQQADEYVKRFRKSLADKYKLDLNEYVHNV